jgi:DNA-binding response OmpR family regulator
VDSKANGQSVISPKQSDPLTLVDEKARIVLIGDRELHLTQQEFEVFHHLYLHVNEVCTNEELLRVALKGNYSDDNLYTLISRIRRKIEPDPKYPRYLINEANAGYRLISKPE